MAWTSSTQCRAASSHGSPPSASHWSVVEPYQKTQNPGHQLTLRSELATARPSRVSSDEGGVGEGLDQQREAEVVGDALAQEALAAAEAAHLAERLAQRGDRSRRRQVVRRSRLGQAAAGEERLALGRHRQELVGQRPPPVVDVGVAALAPEPDHPAGGRQARRDPVEQRDGLPPRQALVVVRDVAEVRVQGEALVQQAGPRPRGADEEHRRRRARPTHWCTTRACGAAWLPPVTAAPVS